MITAWAVKNGRLPTAIADVFGTAPPPDAWGKPVVYVYDSNLTATISGGLCGRSAITGQEVAFLLISGGDDMTVNSSAASIASGVQSGLVIEKDIYRSVPLMELLSQAGCAGATQGRLKILNNELPNACRGKTYSATIFSDGGVPPISFTYSGQPAWLIPTRTRFETLSSANAISPPTSQTVVVTATDTAANSVNRSYTFNIYSCAASP